MRVRFNLTPLRGGNNLGGNRGATAAAAAATIGFYKIEPRPTLHYAILQDYPFSEIPEFAWGSAPRISRRRSVSEQNHALLPGPAAHCSGFPLKCSGAEQPAAFRLMRDISSSSLPHSVYIVRILSFDHFSISLPLLVVRPAYCKYTNEWSTIIFLRVDLTPKSVTNNSETLCHFSWNRRLRYIFNFPKLRSKNFYSVKIARETSGISIKFMLQQVSTKDGTREEATC